VSKSLGISDDRVEQQTLLLYIFLEKPKHGFKFSELRDEMSKAMNKIIRDGTLAEYLQDFESKEYITKSDGKYQLAIDSSQIDSVVNKYDEVLGSDIPLEQKVNIILPRYQADALLLFNTLITTDISANHNFADLAKLVRKTFFKTVSYLPEKDRQAFCSHISDKLTVTENQLIQQISQNRIKYLREDNYNKLGISENKSNSSSTQPESRKQF